jgi:Tol biopolymer transport system component
MTLFFFDPARGIVARELTSGAETIAASNEAWPSGEPGVALGLVSFSVSPDGQSIAFTARDTIGKMALVEQRVGGEARELANVPAPNSLDLHGWTPEGDALIYSELRDDTKGRQLWRAPMDGRPPQRLVTPAALDIATSVYISLSPDGRKLGYTHVALVWDLWILENFLPAAR